MVKPQKRKNQCFHKLLIYIQQFSQPVYSKFYNAHKIIIKLLCHLCLGLHGTDVIEVHDIIHMTSILPPKQFYYITKCLNGLNLILYIISLEEGSFYMVKWTYKMLLERKFIPIMCRPYWQRWMPIKLCVIFLYHM